LSEAWTSIPLSLLYDRGVPKDAKIVFLVLNSHVGGNDSVWPSHKTIAEEAGVSLSQVKVMLVWLRDNGHIQWTQRRRDENNSLTSNEYVILGRRGPAVRPKKPEGVGQEVAEGVGQEVADPQPGGGLPLRHPLASNKNQLNKNQGTRSTSATQMRLVNDEEPTAEVQRLCVLLADLIAENDDNHKRPTITMAWYRECRLLIERDGRSAKQVEAAIRWSQANIFWKANILGMPKLREKYSELSLQARRERDAAPPKQVAAAGRFIPFHER
jgi:hypothetical protein